MCRKLIHLTSLVLVLAIGSVAQAGLAEWEAAISGANPLHWYKFNETTGTDCIDSGSAGLNGVYSGVSLNQEGYFGAGTAAVFTRSGSNVVNFTGATDLDTSWTAEYIVKTTKPPGAQEAQALHDSDATSVRLAGWTSLGEVGFTLYGVEDYRFTPEEGLTLDDLVIQEDEWMHLVWRRDDAGGTQMFFNGILVGTSTDSVPLGRLRIGTRGAVTNALDGVLDEAVVFGRALTDADIIAHADAAGLVERGAMDPSPADGAIHEDTWTSLGWSPGYGAVSHDVYLGDNFDDVDAGTADTFRGNQTGMFFVIGFPGFPYPDGLVPGKTYYWRIDEVEADGTIQKGNVWSFMIPPKTAYNPDPADGARFVPLDATLSWTAGFGARLHTAYFGDNFDDVNTAAGGLPEIVATYTPGPLEKDKTYYWRVDEFDAVATHKGNVWSFKTLPDVAVTDPDLALWLTLDEGEGTIAVDWSGHDNHGTLEGDPTVADGKFGQALAFEGSRIAIPASDSLTADLFQGTFTLTAWINPKRTGNTWQQIFRSMIAADTSNDTLFINNDGRLSWRGRVGGAWAGGMCETAPNVVPADQWTHAAVTGDGTNFRIYVNGALSQESAFQITDGSNANYYVGGNPTASGESYTGMIDDLRVYNKLLTEVEIKQAMRGDTSLAWDPSPANRSVPEIDQVVPLSWSPGDNASQHDVYFGTDRDAVADADESDTTGIYRGRQGITSYTPPEGIEWGGGPYYWRIDEYNTDGTISTGRPWSFTVADYLTLDDFEDYDAGDNQIWYAWKDGLGYGTLGTEPYSPGNGTGSAVGDETTLSYCEETIVHGGGRSMPYWYDNNKPGKFKYSEAELTLKSPRRDWTQQAVQVLTIWFRGNSDNAAESMYVVLNGSAVLYHDNPNAALITDWTEWPIDLQAFADQGVVLTNVDRIAIGFGNRNNPQIGGSGKMYFDDIRLYRPIPEPEAPETP